MTTTQQLLYTLNDLAIDMRAEARGIAADRLELAAERVQQHDALRTLAERVANLNAKAGKIGAGMLASLVEDAAHALGRK